MQISRLITILSPNKDSYLEERMSRVDVDV